MKDRIKARLGWNFTAGAIRALVEKEWLKYPVVRISHHIMSMSKCVEACIADNGGNSFNFKNSEFSMYAGHMHLYVDPDRFKNVMRIWVCMVVIRVDGSLWLEVCRFWFTIHFSALNENEDTPVLDIVVFVVDTKFSCPLANVCDTMSDRGSSLLYHNIPCQRKSDCLPPKYKCPRLALRGC